MGVRVHRVTRLDLLNHLVAALQGVQARYYANVNAHALNLAWENPLFRDALNRADLCFVDGHGVLLAARWCGVELGERLTFADWMPAFWQRCAQRHAAVFWLGDTPEVAAAFAAWLRSSHPEVQLSGWHHGFFDAEGRDNEDVLATIEASAPHILLVGMGMPRQELWICQHWQRLSRIPSLRLVLPSGGYARVAIGAIKRGPRWLIDHGGEWLYRFWQQPRHTWRRYWLGNPMFLYRAMAWRYLGAKPRRADAAQRASPPR